VFSGAASFPGLRCGSQQVCEEQGALEGDIWERLGVRESLGEPKVGLEGRVWRLMTRCIAAFVRRVESTCAHCSRSL
jgi:hypothetical protein